MKYRWLYLNIGVGNLKQYTVYMHISPSNKRYIGITSRTPKQRWNNGNGYRNNIHFWRAICKYGWDNFQHIIIAKELDEVTAKWLEVELIKIWDSTNQNKGYNITLGGEGGNGYKVTEEELKKRSERMKGENNPMYGKCGELNPMHRRTWWDENTPQEKIDKWRENHKKGHEYFKGEGNPFFNCKHTEESKIKIGNASRNRTHKGNEVILLNNLKVFNSITELSREINVSRKTIRDCCNNKIKNVKDEKGNIYICVFYKDYIHMTNEEIKLKIIIAKNDIGKNDVPIICITTKRFFTSITKAERYYNIYGIYKCACGKYKTCGKLIDGTPLVWRYLVWKHDRKYRIKK